MLQRLLAPQLKTTLSASGKGSSDGHRVQTRLGSHFGDSESQGREVKVMIVTMFDLEAKTWLDRLGPWDTTSVPGLAPDYQDVHCNRKEFA